MLTVFVATSFAASTASEALVFAVSTATCAEAFATSTPPFANSLATSIPSLAESIFSFAASETFATTSAALSWIWYFVSLFHLLMAGVTFSS